jgi:hypothetical protein
LVANEKAVLKSGDSQGQKGLIREQEETKNKGEWLQGDLAQLNK